MPPPENENTRSLTMRVFSLMVVGGTTICIVVFILPSRSWYPPTEIDSCQGYAYFIDKDSRTLQRSTKLGVGRRSLTNRHA